MGIEVERVTGCVDVVTMSADFAADGFSVDGMRRISEVVNGVLDDPSARAMVITGSGRMFCAGADIQGFADAIESDTIVESIRDLTDALHPLLLRMRRSDKICIAAINGAAAGGGLGLALACDARIASSDAKLVAGFAKLGLSPDGGTTWLLPRLVGEQAARRFILSNEVWDAESACQRGAVDEVVAGDVLVDRAVESARDWGVWSAHTREATKHLLDVQSVQDFESHLRHEQLLIMSAGASQGFAEGVDAFLNRREPEFD